MSSAVWIGLAAAFAVLVYVGWRLRRGRPDRSVPPEVPSRPAPGAEALIEPAAPAAVAGPPPPVVPGAPIAPVAPVVPVAPVAPGAPVEPRARVEPRAPAPLVQPAAPAPLVDVALPAVPAAPAAVVAPPPAGPVFLVPEPVVAPGVAGQPRDEFVPIEHADAALWSSAVVVEDVPDRLAALTALLAPARQAPAGSEGGALFSVRFEHGEALRLARAEVATIPARAAAARDGAPPAGWLGREAAVSLAGTVLGAWVRERYLAALDAQLAEIRSGLAAIAPKLEAADQRRLKTLVQDLSRFVREARDHYAAAIRKTGFVERVAEAYAEAVGAWSVLQDRVGALRAQLEALASAPRYGEVQLERTVAGLRALHEERRVEALGARVLAALAALRLALGDAQAPAGARSLAAVSAAHRLDLEGEQALRRRLADCERAAKGPPYAGKGEFESNRAAARSWLAKLDGVAADGASRYFADANAAVAAGFLDGEATDWILLWRCDREGGVSEARRARA